VRKDFESYAQEREDREPMNNLMDPENELNQMDLGKD